MCPTMITNASKPCGVIKNALNHHHKCQEPCLGQSAFLRRGTVPRHGLDLCRGAVPRHGLDLCRGAVPRHGLDLCRGAVYDVKANTVTITVMCCNPEKIRDKLCCMVAGVIKSIEIKEPPPKKLLPPPTHSVVPPRTCCGPCSEGRGGGPCYNGNVVPPRTCCGSCSEGRGGGPCYDGNVVPPRTCCGPCSQGYGDGPCYDGYRVPPPPQPCYDGYYGQGSRSCRPSRCDYYISVDNPQGCSIM
ncbi:hypothetical protein BUALT_Bualt03G0090200 [Buddleja alternifolia]|uniref:Uncharacterized protein n=1 Tax=Buddleja alternifolia TaxID=168488 RepID=A0AAV6XS89_9LAMI|nr:hypothetical protein BUALT_Bualt03G0090200 [Buddleja alternifolia]